MDLFFMPHQKRIGAVILTTLLLLGATGACSGVPKSREPASPAQAPVASDAELASRVKAAVHASPVNDMHIDVSVENGDVVLSGFVEDSRALLDALQAAQKAAGGRKVIDALSIMRNSAH